MARIGVMKAPRREPRRSWAGAAVKTAKERLTLIEKDAASTNRDALNIFTKLVKAYQTDDPELRRVRNESLLADLLGDAPVLVPRASVDQPVIDLFNRFLDLLRVPENFTAVETMARSYPWKGKISHSQHLENCFFLIGHVAYILEERLKRFLNSVSACAKERNSGVDVKEITTRIIKVHKQTFGSIVAARGAHVHQGKTIPREIERVALLELIEGVEPIYRFFHRQAIRLARKQMIARANNARVQARVLIAAALRLTRAVWEPMVQEELAKALAKKAKRSKKRQRLESQ
jgi:hypothetical protein